MWFWFLVPICGSNWFWFAVPVLSGLFTANGNVNLNDIYGSKVLSDCQIEYPDMSDETKTVSAPDVAHAFAWGVIDILGFIPVVGELSAASLHFAETFLPFGQDSSSATTDIYKESMQNAFSESWKCTQLYIKEQVDLLKEDQIDIANANILAALEEVQNTMTTFNTKTGDLAKTASWEQGVAPAINDVGSQNTFNAIHFGISTQTPAQCRIYMPLLTTSIADMLYAFKAYLDASGSDSHIIDGFGRSLTYTLIMFKACAPYALDHVIKNSQSKTLDDIKSELSIIYDGDLFCSWVQYASENLFHFSYQFSHDNDPLYNFEEWEVNTCGTGKWILYVNDALMSYDTSNRFNEYFMDVKDLWRNDTQQNGIIYSQREYYVRDEFNGEDWAYTMPTDETIYSDCYEPWGSEYIGVPYSEYSWKNAVVDGSYSGQKFPQLYTPNDRFMFMGCRLNTNCIDTEDKTSISTKTHSCPHGSYLTGGRYLVYDTDELKIGGLQLICSNPTQYRDISNYYNVNYASSFQQLNAGYSGDYKWSPWYICPIGYHLDLKIIAFNACEKKTEYDEFLEDLIVLKWYGDESLRTISTDQKVIFKCVQSEYKWLENEQMMITSHDGLCLTVEGDVDYSGVDLEECNQLDQKQQFFLLNNQIRNLNGKCVQFDENKKLQIMPCDETAKQIWHTDYGYMPQKSGEYRILSSQQLCMDQVNMPYLYYCQVDAETNVMDPNQRWGIFTIKEIGWLGSKIVGGDGFIQIGQFRIGKVDFGHFSISAKNTQKTNIVFRNDGMVWETSSVFSGEGYGLWDKSILSTPINVAHNRFGIVFGNDEWCLGLSNVNHLGQYHLSLSYKSSTGVSKTARIWREDGAVSSGPRNDFSCWTPDSANIVISGTGDINGDYIQFGNMFRIGDTGINGVGQYHLSVVSKIVITVYRDDGKVHKTVANNLAGWAHDNKFAPF